MTKKPHELPYRVTMDQQDHAKAIVIFFFDNEPAARAKFEELKTAECYTRLLKWTPNESREIDRAGPYEEDAAIDAAGYSRPDSPQEPTQQAGRAATSPASEPPPFAMTGEEPVTRPKAVQTGLEIMAGRSHDWDSAALFMGPVEPAPKKSAKQRDIEAKNLSLF